MDAKEGKGRLDDLGSGTMCTLLRIKRITNEAYCAAQGGHSGLYGDLDAGGNPEKGRSVCAHSRLTLLYSGN